MASGLPQDLTNRIANVKWGGEGVFVAARYFIGRTNPCAIVYGKQSGNKINWTALGAFGIGEGGSIRDCAVGGRIKQEDGSFIGRTTFVAVGVSDDGADIPSYGSIILTSFNGKDWDETYKKTDIVEETFKSTEYATGVVWDEDAFYVSMAAEEQQGDSHLFSERIYKSANGKSWTLAGEVGIDVISSIELREIDSVLLEHCNKPENVGGEHPAAHVTKMPDGYQSYDKSADVFMQPKDLKRFSAQGMIYDLAEGQVELSAKATIRRAVEEGVYIEEDKNISTQCFAVANYGAAWVAGGGKSDMDVSFDKGQTWQKSYTHSGDEIVDICAIVAGKPEAS